MHLCLAPINYLRRLEQWQVLQPQAGCLGFAVAKPPWLDDLMGGGDGSADNAYRVFDAPPIYWCRHKQAHKVQRLNLLALLAVEMPTAANGKMRTRRMRHHQIPTISQYILNRLLQMPLRIGLAFQQITAPCVMPAPAKCIADAGAVFTSN
jgi:hypothetical protein